MPEGESEGGTDSRPIGIFDSGVGGLTVVRSVIDRLPHESIVYIGDTARTPYGPRSVDEIKRFATEIAEELVRHRVKMVVVACNSVEVAAVEEVTTAAGVPVVGVIEPGLRAALRTTRSGRIGLIGTEATVASGAYDRALQEMIEPDAEIELVSAACPAFVDHVEVGDTSSMQLVELASEYLAPLKAANIDTLILGCTHYPLLADLLTEVAGSGVQLVSSADETAHDVEVALRDHDRERQEPAAVAAARESTSTRSFLCTGDPAQFEALADRFLGRKISQAHRIVLGEKADRWS